MSIQKKKDGTSAAAAGCFLYFNFIKSGANFEATST
jgi:hypothetical protein